jgi:SNF2 family DNA or RNA helicase
MTKRQREAAIAKFQSDSQCRVMLISNVGAAGLNLTVASVVIFLVSGRLSQVRLQGTHSQF